MNEIMVMLISVAVFCLYIICNIICIVLVEKRESKEEKIKRINKEYEKELEDRFNRLLNKKEGNTYE